MFLVHTQAYKNFGSRVNNLRKRLVEHTKSLPRADSPVPSPTMDAPSPGNTPPQADCLQTMDMELDDDDPPPPPPPPPDNAHTGEYKHRPVDSRIEQVNS